MATTSIHIPDDLLEKLDRLASDRGMSRNRLIVESCREAVARQRGPWPAGYLEGKHLHDADLRLLRESAAEFDAAVIRARATRQESPF